MNEIIISPAAIVAPSVYLEHIKAMVLDTVGTHSKRAYGRALNDFLTWYTATGQAALNKAAINAHVTALKAAGVTDSSINQRLAALRKLAMESADNGLIDESTAQAIKRVGNIKIQGKKLGNWLSNEQAKAMIAAPQVKTIKGLRDRAILAVMLGCGLRREEIVELTVEHLQQREGRWVILDLKGKHNRTRTVPIASWIKAIVDHWTHAARIGRGVLFRRVRKGGAVLDVAMTPQAIWNIVQSYAPVANLAPHDLRRTFAKLAAGNGAPLVQIQKTLGHASVQTTEHYIGADQDLKKAPSDYIEALG
jgi:site-specific recombinase XerD